MFRLFVFNMHLFAVLLYIILSKGLYIPASLYCEFFICLLYMMEKYGFEDIKSLI